MEVECPCCGKTVRMKEEKAPQDSEEHWRCSECSSVLVLNEDTGALEPYNG